MNWLGRGFSYRKVQQIEHQFDESQYEDSNSTEKALNEDTSFKPIPPRSWKLSRALHWICHIVLAIDIILRVWPQGTSQIHPESSIWTPGLSVLSDKTIPIRFNGSLFDEKSIFFGPPTPQRVDAWERLLDVGKLNVSRQDMIQMGRSLDSAQFPEEYGGGYVALSEAAHYVHCIYTLYKVHYYPKNPDAFGEAFRKDYEGTTEEVKERHFNHCIDIIRQKLMCSPEPGVITLRWVKGAKAPLPDFNSIHSCASADQSQNLAVSDNWPGSGTPFAGYEALYRWAEHGRVRSAPGEFDYQWVTPKDAVLLEDIP